MTPSASSASLAIASARSYLDDVNAVTWSDARLMPMLQEAHRELTAKLMAVGVGVIREQSDVITVSALATGQTSPIAIQNVPANLIIPISLLERDVSSSISNFTLMKQCDFVPDIEPSDRLIYWAWMGQQLMVIGSTSDRQVQIRYRGSLTTPQTLNDNIGFSFGELYLGPRIASLALPSRKDLMDTAQYNLGTVINYNVVGEQGVPKRRRGYQRYNGFNRFYR